MLKAGVAVAPKSTGGSRTGARVGIGVGPSGNMEGGAQAPSKIRVSNKNPNVWMRKARGACNSAIKQSRIFQLWLPFALRVQGCFEWLNGNKRKATNYWQNSLELGKQMNLPYEQAMSS